ncbi:MAG: hypothetical protein P8X63_04160, partial [Desulfuromonadaceae bacterium]
LVLCSATAFSETEEQTSAGSAVKFNYGVLTSSRDASLFVHALELLQSGNSQDVAAFMEYQLDEIACGTRGYFDQMNSTQQKMVRQQLQRIRDYREKHPRTIERFDPREFSDFFLPFDESLARCADEALAKIH